MPRIFFAVFIFFLFSINFTTNAQCSFNLTAKTDISNALVGTRISYLEEGPKQLSIEEVTRHSGFKENKADVVNLGMTESYFWLRFSVCNSGYREQLMLHVDQPTLAHVEWYAPDVNGHYGSPDITGTDYPFNTRVFNIAGFAFPVSTEQDGRKDYYLRIRGNTPLVLPVFLGTREVITAESRKDNVFFGVYAGIILCMVLYNLFLKFSIRDDSSYTWYVLHTVFVGLTQAGFTGYAFQYLWPDHPWLANQSVFIFTCLVSIFGIIFMQTFLNMKAVLPKMNRVFYVFFALYLIISALSLSGEYVTAYKILQPTQGTVAILILVISINLVRKGFKQARFYLFSWFLLLVSILIFALKDFNLVPYNDFTSTMMLSGSALQVILLSFALGDKINILEAEKQMSQEEALRISLENERIIREQNVMLESKVKERTMELEESNVELERTLEDLKSKETQLVESEKMASLGQLTAGIAHEINNPINFVTSNVNPLKRDVGVLIDMLDQMEALSLEPAAREERIRQIETIKEDADYDYLKTEIDFLLKGISEGASRTAEIVKGLRIFSRLDEDDLKRADVNEGLNSTIVIVNHLLNNVVEVEKNYGDIPMIECYPGKLNQVFLNMMSNAIHAIHKRWKGEPGGKLTIETHNGPTNVRIVIKDNGTGMDEVAKKKLFEPFFTTKDVGEGTGLGLSIAYNTVRKHAGTIEVISALGEGTEFIITLPINQ